MKRGQIQLSFGMIFSIIIIVATLLVGGYVVYKFIILKDDASCKIFYQKLQERINDAWRGDGTSIDTKKEPLPNLPAKIKSVCFGNSTQIALSNEDKINLEEARDYGDRKDNLFLIPKNGCGEGDFAYRTEHSINDGFFCSDVVKGKISVFIKKERTESLVRISEK